jgi:hypothetical protein
LVLGAGDGGPRTATAPGAWGRTKPRIDRWQRRTRSGGRWRLAASFRSHQRRRWAWPWRGSKPVEKKGGGVGACFIVGVRNSPSSSTLRMAPCASRGMRCGQDPWRGRRGKRHEQGGWRCKEEEGGRNGRQRQLEAEETSEATTVRRGRGGREEATMSIERLLKF